MFRPTKQKNTDAVRMQNRVWNMARIVLSLCILLLALPVHAQQFDIPGASSAVSIHVSPLFPAPNTTVTLTLKSPLLDLERALITWHVDGTQVSEDEGLTSITTTMGAAGESIDISASVVGSDGEALAFTTITPASVDLLWEAEGYVPGLYRGRTLPIAGAALSVVAIPNFVRGGQQIAAKDLIYTWKKNGTVLGSLSGKGRSSIRIESPFFSGTDTISVEVRTSTGDISAQETTAVHSVDPMLVLYEEHPLFGTLFHSGLGKNSFVPENEATFTAAPYFAPVVNASDSRLSYEWRVNKRDIAASAEHPSRITINAEGSDGIALIELLVSHENNVFFEAQGAWQVTFSQGRDGIGGINPFTGQ